MEKLNTNTEKYRKAVGALLINHKKMIYAFQRIDYVDSWQGVEGGIDNNEDEQTAIYREIREEVGIDKKDLIYVSETKEYLKYLFKGGEKYGFIGQEKKFYLFNFIGDEKKFLINTEYEKEFINWKLVDKNELLNLVPVFKRELYENVLFEFENFI